MLLQRMWRHLVPQDDSEPTLAAADLVHFMARALQPAETEEAESEARAHPLPLPLPSPPGGERGRDAA